MSKNWFEIWFNTPYYHILYSNRNTGEARIFLHNLIENLNIPTSGNILDLACGKGRHSVTLNKLGYNVLGVDLSENSISAAKTHVAPGLEFRVHDMRNVIPQHTFTAVFNLFTSFGYFDNTEDNLKVLNSVNKMLLPNGLLIIDFMNTRKVIRNLVHSEEKVIEDVKFTIRRRYDGSQIYKDIEFSDRGENYAFTERVQALEFEDFSLLLKQSNFEILRTFGDFALSPYEVDSSDRLIIIARKNK